MRRHYLQFHARETSTGNNPCFQWRGKLNIKQPTISEQIHGVPLVNVAVGEVYK